jgi:hypothetical protein
MKVLTLKNPWAWAVVNGVKKIENRTWSTNYRGPLLIHAGVSRTDLGLEGDRMPGLPAHDRLVFGAIVGVVDEVDCVLLERVNHQPFATGPFCFLLANARPLAVPFPCRGALGLWTPPAAFRLPT